MKWHNKAFMLFFLCVVCLTGCRHENNKAGQESEGERLGLYNQTLAFVKVVQENSDLGGLKLLARSEVSEENANLYNYDQPEMAILPETNKLFGYYFPYPADSANTSLTQIRIEVKPYHIFHITVDQKMEDAVTVLNKKGFVEVNQGTEKDPLTYFVFRKYDVYLFLSVEKDTQKISAITISIFHDDGSDKTVVY